MSDIASRRFDLRPLTIVALEALIAGDRPSLEIETAARFPEPLAAPPLMEDALTHLLDVVRTHPVHAQWSARLIIERASGAAVGSIGLAGPPDAEGTIMMGYSVYASHQRRGVASEAAEALVAWALDRPGVKCVVATIPPGHIASQRVAARAGLRRTDRTEIDQDEGPVEVWERWRD